MLRVLFDKNVPYLLRLHLTDYQVQTADAGWQIPRSNGTLLPDHAPRDFPAGQSHVLEPVGFRSAQFFAGIVGSGNITGTVQTNGGFGTNL
jgi:hypothetical protein